MTPEEFEEARRDTILMLHPDYMAEIRGCADAVEMSLEQFLAVLDSAADDGNYYEPMGSNEAYNDFDWNKIWSGWELLTGKQRPITGGAWDRVPFTCAC